MGYHLQNIKKGTYGHLSKVQEELDEALDAEKQNIRIMVLMELSDICGALKGYLEVHFPDFSIQDLIQMSDRTDSAFKDETRV